MSAENKVPAIRFEGFSGEWEENQLGEVYKFQYGQYNNNPSDGGIYPVYGANGIIGGYSFFNAQDSIVIGHMGENAGSVLWGNGKHFVTYNGTIATSKISDFIPKFGYYILCNLNIKKKCGGSGQPFLSYETLQKLSGIFPKLTPEQTKIGNYFQQLDTLIAQHQKKHDKLLNLKKSLLEKLFPKQGATEPEIRFKGFSGEWEERRLLSNFERIIDFRGRTPKKLGLDWSKNGYLALSALNVKNGFIDFNTDANFGSDELYDKWMSGNELHKNQVLFTTEAPMGNVAQVPDNNKYILSQRTIAFDVNMKLIEENFLAVILRAPLLQAKFASLSSGGTAQGVSQKSLASVDALFPLDIKDQTKIGNLFKQLDTLIAQHQAQLKKLNNIKQACLEKMFV